MTQREESEMQIGGYDLKSDSAGVTVSHYESNQSFFLQGDDASQFLGEWDSYTGENFASFLFDFEYQSLLN